MDVVLWRGCMKIEAQPALAFFILMIACVAPSQGAIDPEGKPESAESAPAHYSVWHDERGWHLRATMKDVEHHFKGSILANEGEFTDVVQVRPEDRAPHSDVFVLGPAHQMFTFDFAGKGGTVGVDFRVKGTSPTLAFTLELDEKEPKPALPRIFIGKSGTHPTASPFELPAHPSVAAPAPGSKLPPPHPTEWEYVPGSTKKCCQLTGDIDWETKQPTASQTRTNYGIIAADGAPTVAHKGRLYFLMGDPILAKTFRGRPNELSDPPRNTHPFNDDCIGWALITPDLKPEDGFKIEFPRNEIGAFRSPHVFTEPAQKPVPLRVNEGPFYGISISGKLYVVFATDNFVYPPGPSPERGLGFSTRLVMTAAEDDGVTGNYRYLYDLSKGEKCLFSCGAMATSRDGFVYFWSTNGGKYFRRSAPFLARKRAADIERVTGMEFFAGLAADGKAAWSPKEADAAPIFKDYPAEGDKPEGPQMGVGELGVEWNRFAKRWVFLYNCGFSAPTSPAGIKMRLAKDPWGPWTDPQTIFDLWKDGGYGHFIHIAVTKEHPQDDGLCPGGEHDWGSAYWPSIISHFTTGDEAHGTSTFYYTVSCWRPYGPVVLRTTIQRVPERAGK
jgi:hypothetical protein